MSEEKEHIDDLIGLVLTGEASPEETDALELWVRASEENAHYFRQMQTLFSHSENEARYDVDSAWSKVKAEISGARVVSIQRNNRKMFAYAAAIVALIGIGGLVFFNLKNRTEFASAKSGDTPITDTIASGIVATLNRHTELSFETEKKTGNTKATLNGEAQFHIEHNDERTFIVKAGDLIIEDVGTIFNVRALPGEDSVEVSVTEGEVSLYTIYIKGMVVKAGETGVYRKSTKTFVLRNTVEGENPGSYSDKNFSFRNTPLSKVIRQINDAYNTNLELSSEAMGKCRISVSFNQDEIETIIQVIAETMNWKVYRQGDQTVFTGDSCD